MKMSLTKPIPKKMRDEMAKDPFYKQCCITGKNSKDEKIDWHHNLVYAGSRVNEPFAILPVAKSVHDNITVYKSQLDYIMWSRATPLQRQSYSKAVDYEAYYQFLKQKYEV